MVILQVSYVQVISMSLCGLGAKKTRYEAVRIWVQSVSRDRVIIRVSQKAFQMFGLQMNGWAGGELRAFDTGCLCDCTGK